MTWLLRHYAVYDHSGDLLCDVWLDLVGLTRFKLHVDCIVDQKSRTIVCL